MDRRCFLEFAGSVIPAWMGLGFLEPKKKPANDDDYFLGFFQRNMLDTFPYKQLLVIFRQNKLEICVLTNNNRYWMIQLDVKFLRDACEGSVDEIKAYRLWLHRLLQWVIGNMQASRTWTPPMRGPSSPENFEVSEYSKTVRAA